MMLLQEDLAELEQHWAVASLGEGERRRARDVVNARLVSKALGAQLCLDFVEQPSDAALLERLATAYEVAAAEGLDALLHPAEETKQLARQARAGGFRAFEVLRTLAIPQADMDRIHHVLHLSALAYAGDRWADLRRWVLENEAILAPPDTSGVRWDERVLIHVYEAWLRLFRKKSWIDVEGIAKLIAALRSEQSLYESEILADESTQNNRVMALRLVALYHWAQATEQLSKYMLQGEPGSISETLDLHFENATAAAGAAADVPLEMLLRWLHVAARQMAAGSLWAATAGINSRVSRFVKQLTSAARPMLELLPPQRAALTDQGLLDPASRAVVVDLPTSGGKTTLAQFRILQALNAFSEDRGWVAYVAPTRALVAQLARRMRRDFSGIDVRVEQMTGGLEIDSFEKDMLSAERAFDVLIATPEKLGLIIRNQKLTHRPLALLVLDEAHNIEDESRGLRIELLLATVRQDCPGANYLLLMPFVPETAVLARWLDPERGRPISLGTSAWQPNERIVGIYSLRKSDQRRGARKIWGLNYRTLVTTPNTIHLRGTHAVGGDFPLNLPVSKVGNSLTLLTAAMAKTFSAAGRTSIAVADSPSRTWKLAKAASESTESPTRLPGPVRLVQGFLRSEFGPDFELISLLDKQIAVHHSGLTDEVRALVEWLAEEGFLRILCATTTIAQGINFPVASIFLQRVEHPSRRGPIPMKPREFWNLAGRAGRVGQDSVGIVGIATNSDDKTEYLTSFVGRATRALASRLIELMDQILDRSPEAQLMAVTRDEQWADFRSFIAHILRESDNLSQFQARTETVLRGTLGFNVMRGRSDPSSQKRASTLIALTNAYAARISSHPGLLAFSDATGFDPEGIRTAMREMQGLERRLTSADWAASSLFGRGGGLSSLIGVMMKIPALNQALEEVSGSGGSKQQIARMAKSWVKGDSIQSIAERFFRGDDATASITKACRGISKALVNSGVWGLAALSQLPGSGIDWENLPEARQREINLLPAFLYHGVDTEEAVLMRMNQVPRSVAPGLGRLMKRALRPEGAVTVQDARGFLRALRAADWERVVPESASLDGSQYREVWQVLTGET